MSRALIVDDNAANRSLLEAFCQALGLTVESVESGAAALQAMGAGETAGHRRSNGAEDYSVVLMDIHMPEMDGVETARRIRAVEGDSLPIIAVTADTTDANRARCLEVGMVEVVHKPVSTSTLGPVLFRYIEPKEIS